MPRISLSILHPDATLQRTLDRIDAAQLQQVAGALGDPDNGIHGVLDVAQDTPPDDRPCQLDLIAHARDGELRFARWLISASEEQSASLRRQLEDGTVDEVRLLGCSTADTVAGRAAMGHLKDVLGVAVFGTTSLIGARDFDESGFINDALLIEYDDLPPDEPSTLLDDIGWLDLDLAPETDRLEEQLRAETEQEARADSLAYDEAVRWPVQFAADQLGTLADLLARRTGHPRVAPGLLTLPEVEVLFPAPAACEEEPRYFRVTSLLGGQCIRVYPCGYPDGVLLKMIPPVVLDDPPPPCGA